MSIINRKSFTFLVDWTDSKSGLCHDFLLRYFENPPEIEMVAIKTKKAPLDLSTFQLGAYVTILGRSLRIKECTDLFAGEETTCAMIKPNAYKHIGEIMEKIQLDSGLRIMKLRMFMLTRGQAEAFYCEHRDKEFFKALVDFMTSGVVVAIALTGPNAVNRWRTFMGPTSSEKARVEAPKSLRALFGIDGTRNAVHGSDSVESAKRELDFFFGQKHWTTAINTHCSLCLVKPHAFHDFAGSIVAQILREDLEISAMELVYCEISAAEKLMEVYRGIIPEYVEYWGELTTGPCLVMEVRQANVVEKLRALVGPLDPDLAKRARPQSMRAKFGIDRVRNAVHCTDLVEDGVLECNFFFN